MTTQTTIEKKPEPLSRLGRKPVEIPTGVKVSVNNNVVHVEGSRGKLELALNPIISAKVEGSQVKVFPMETGGQSKALHGLSRKLVLNMIEGVTKGFQKRLIIEGVGIRAEATGNKLKLTLGFSHPALFESPKDVKVTVDAKMGNLLIIEGNDKQKVGQVAAQIRSIKKPEPYKGTGIRYENEVVKRKAGKAAVGATGGAGAKK